MVILQNPGDSIYVISIIIKYTEWDTTELNVV